MKNSFFESKLQFQIWIGIIFLVLVTVAGARAEGDPQKPQRAKSNGAARVDNPQNNKEQSTQATLLTPYLPDIVDNVKNVVVSIESPAEEGGMSHGSGFLIDENGLLVTNFHVIREALKNAGTITVLTTDGERYKASVKGHDEATDLALLEIKTSDKKLSAAKLGDSDALRVGEWAIVIGSPFGLDNSVTLGIISAKGRSGLDGEYDDYLQTDARINFGNSGGPLFNVRGEVIGINTLILSRGQGLGFAIPVNILKDIVSDLRDRGRVRRSSLSLETSDIPSGLAQTLGLPTGVRGIRISKVERDTPAAKAGLRRDDVITAVNGSPIISSAQFNRLISRMSPGTKVDITFWRGERDFTVPAVVSEKK